VGSARAREFSSGDWRVCPHVSGVRVLLLLCCLGDGAAACSCSLAGCLGRQVGIGIFLWAGTRWREPLDGASDG